MNERLSVGKDVDQLAELDIQSRTQSDGALELELAQTKVFFTLISDLTFSRFDLWKFNAVLKTWSTKC